MTGLVQFILTEIWLGNPILMIPEAFQGVWEYRRRRHATKFSIGDKIEALAVVAGFLVSFVLTRITK